MHEEPKVPETTSIRGTAAGFSCSARSCARGGADGEHGYAAVVYGDATGLAVVTQDGRPAAHLRHISGRDAACGYSDGGVRSPGSTRTDATPGPVGFSFEGRAMKVRRHAFAGLLRNCKIVVAAA